MLGACLLDMSINAMPRLVRLDTGCVLGTHLNLHGDGLICVPHALDDHAGNLTGDNVIGHTVLDLGRPILMLSGQELEQAMVHPVKVCTVLPRVIQAAGRDLGELAAADPSRRDEGVDG